MAPMSTIFARTAEPTGSNPEELVYTSAIIFAFFSLLVTFLIIPPLVQHWRNRNIGATLCVFYAMIMNLMAFTNAVLWPNDDLEHWYSGSGLCDVKVKLQIAWSVAAPATLICVLRALANAMNTDRLSLGKTKAQRWRGRRDTFSTASRGLIYVPPLLLVLVDAYFALLILYRLCRYRRTFSIILAHNDTTKSRFLRLYILCIALNKSLTSGNGKIVFDRFIWLGCGIMVFLTFGFGKEAVGMYRNGLLAVGLGRLFPGLGSDHNRSHITVFELGCIVMADSIMADRHLCVS
ncbi:hypothetical protein KC328_g96 [Hortaea werneckii]|nr:hypothetical protein KC328_g96 [Hortaea werneckii]